MLNPLQKAAVRHLVAYEYSPPETRLDHAKFAELIGVDVRTLQRWRKDDEFKAALAAAHDEAEDSRDPFATFARHWALEQLYALYGRAKTTNEKRQMLKEIIGNTEHVAAYSDPIDYSDLSDSDLASLCLNRRVSPAAMTETELQRYVKGESCETSFLDSLEQHLESPVISQDVGVLPQRTRRKSSSTSRSRKAKPSS